MGIKANLKTLLEIVQAQKQRFYERWQEDILLEPVKPSLNRELYRFFDGYEYGIQASIDVYERGN